MNCELARLNGRLQLAGSDLENGLGASLDKRCGRQQLDHRPEFADSDGDDCVELTTGCGELRGDN
jgi:hypothetical protein